MPKGVEVLVEDALATIEFVDNSKRGVGLAALLKVGGPESVSKVTRPRVAYIVSEGVARAAGMLDESSTPAVDTEAPAADGPKGYDDGYPDADWSRPALNEYATKLGIPDAHKLPNKPAVLKAIADRPAESKPDSGK